MGSMPVSDHTLAMAQWLREEQARLAAAIGALERLLGRTDLYPAPTLARGIPMRKLEHVESHLEKEING